MGVGPTKNRHEPHLYVPPSRHGHARPDPFGIISSRLYLSKFKSQNVVYQKSRKANHSKETADYECTTINKLGLYARLVKGEFGTEFKRFRYASLEEEECQVALEFTLDVKKDIKTRGKKLRESYQYDGVVVYYPEEPQSGSARVITPSVQLNKRVKGYDYEEKKKNLKFVIHRAVILKSHQAWGSECIRVLIESPYESYYFPLLFAFQDLYLLQNASILENDACSLLEIACGIAKIVLTYLPVARVRSEIDESRLDARYHPEVATLRSRIEKSKSVEQASRSNLVDKHSSSLDKISLSSNPRSNSGNFSSNASYSETKLIQFLTEGVKEFKVDDSIGSLEFEGYLSRSDKAVPDFLQWSRLDGKGSSNELKLDALELLQKAGEESVNLHTRARGRSRDKETSRGSTHFKSKSLVLKSDESESRHRNSISASRAEPSIKKTIISPTESFPDPAPEVKHVAQQFENAASVEIFGKLPDLLFEHGFTQYNFDTSLKPAQIKHQL